MKPLSAALAATLRGTHRLAVRARACEPGQTGASPVGDEIPVFGGDVQLNATAEARGTLSLTTDGTAWDPQPGGSMLLPYGNEVFVERGAYTTPGNAEYVPLGYFKMYEVDQDPVPNGPLTIAGRDRMAGLIEALLPRPRQFKKTESISGVFSALVKEIYPAAVIEFDDDTGNEQLGRQLIVDQDRYAALQTLVATNGKVMYWDHRGHLVIVSPPSSSTPLWEVNAGKDGVLMRSARKLSREGVFNKVVAEGEAPDGDNPAVRVEAWDANPESPTYWDGAFGKVVTFLSAPTITRTAQATSAGRALLERSLGLPYLINFQTVPCPALEPFDPVRVKFSDRTGRETHVIESVKIPLTAAEPMTGTTRERTSVLISSSEG